MASSTTRAVSRLCSIASKISKNQSSLSSGVPLLKSASQSSIKRFSCISRLPVELSSMETMMPLHSAIASARLLSSLSIESQSWGLVPQGNITSELTKLVARRANEKAGLVGSKLFTKEWASQCLYDSILCSNPVE